MSDNYISGLLRNQLDELPSNLVGASVVAVTVAGSTALIRYLSPKYPSLTENLPKSKGWNQDAKFGLFVGGIALSYAMTVDGWRYGKRRWGLD